MFLNVGRALKFYTLSFVATCGLLACASSHVRHTEELTYDGDQLLRAPVRTWPSYESYLRARLAMELQPPDMEYAFREIEQSLKRYPRDPQLLTTLAEIEWQRQRYPQSLVALERVLKSYPDYEPAIELSSEICQRMASSSGAELGQDSSGFKSYCGQVSELKGATVQNEERDSAMLDLPQEKQSELSVPQ